MRRMGCCAVLFLCARGLSLLAQQPATPPAPAGDTALPQDVQPAQTPEQQLEQQIRQVDPLDHSDDKDAKAREKTARDAENRQDQQQTPTPGSIAAGERDTAARQSGPQVVSDDDSSDEPVQEYTGPAVLSRSYSVNRPLIPEQLKWTETLGVSTVYDIGAVGVINSNGTAGNANLFGTMINWGFSGRHYFRHDQIGVKYTGNISEYAGSGAYSGSNNSLAIDYSHVLTRRITFNIAMSGSILSQNYTLGNEYLEPGTTVANINLSSSPNIQITDLGVKQFSTQAGVVWQKSARMSFSAGASYFAIVRNTPGLLGMTGQQANGDMNYRLTRKMTVGGYYSFTNYLFPQGWGTNHVNTGGGIFSYAFSRSLQLRLRGGISAIQSLQLQPVSIPPAIAALLGQSSGLIDVAATTLTSDISAQLIKDFRGGRTASVAYAHGISPGNGFYLASVQESISASVGMPLFRRYMIQAAVGRDTLSAVAQALSVYESDYARLSVSRLLRRGINLNFTATLRHFDVAEFVGVRNQVLLSGGFTWGSTSGRLWPF